MGWRVKNDNLLDPRLCARCGNSGLVYCTWEMNVVFPVPSAGTGVFVVQGQSPNCSLVCTRTPSHLRARSVAECLKKFKLLPNIQGNVGPKSAQNFTNSFDMNRVMLPSHAASESAQPSLDRYWMHFHRPLERVLKSRFFRWLGCRVGTSESILSELKTPLLDFGTGRGGPPPFPVQIRRCKRVF